MGKKKSNNSERLMALTTEKAAKAAERKYAPDDAAKGDRLEDAVEAAVSFFYRKRDQEENFRKATIEEDTLNGMDFLCEGMPLDVTLAIVHK